MMLTITKQDFVEKIAETSGIKQSTVKAVIHSFLNEIVLEIAKNNRLEFRDFGVFEVRGVAGRMAQNPKTMEPIQVPPKRKVKFKIGRLMREGMNNKDKIRSYEPT